MSSQVRVTQLFILPMELDLVFVCLVLHWFREYRNSLESLFLSNSPKRGEVITTDEFLLCSYPAPNA